MSESQYMCILDSNGNKIKIVNSDDIKEKDWTAQWKRGMDLNLLAANQNITQPMRQSYIVQRAIQIISNTAPLAPLNFYRGMDEIPPDHPLRLLFQRPSKNVSYYELMSSIAMYFSLYGEVFIYLTKSMGQIAGFLSSLPAELIVLNPVYMKEVLNDNKTLKGWLYGNKVSIDLDEVIQIKTNNPYNPYRGLSPLDSISFEVKADYKAGQYQEMFFENGAVPGFVLTTHPDDNTPEKELRRYSKLWDQNHRGVSKSHKTAILRGGMDFKTVGLTQKQMNFIETRVMSRDIILQLFGVPKSVFGATEEVNRATAEAQDKSFWEKTIMPLILRIQSKINSDIVYYVDPSITAKFDLTKIPVLQNLYTEDVESAWKLFQIGFSRNELNERFDFGFRTDNDTGNSKYVMMNLINVEDDVRFVPAPEEGKSIDANGVAVKQIDEKQVRQRRNQKRFLKYHYQLERVMKKELESYFFNQMRSVLNSLNKSAKDANDADIYNNINDIWDNENKILIKKITPIMGEVVETGQKYALETLGVDRDVIINEGILLKRVNKITGINTTVSNQIKMNIHEAITNGETIDDISNRIKNVYSMAKKRAIMIARTEVTAGMNEATLAEYKENGVPKNEWLTAGDSKVRDDHVKNASNGPIPVGNTFPSGELYPGQNSVGCRCCLSPVI